jgi:hypothetical protein
VDELVGIIIEQVGKRVREAQLAAQAQEAAGRAAPPIVVRRRPTGRFDPQTGRPLGSGDQGPPAATPPTAPPPAPRLATPVAASPDFPAFDGGLLTEASAGFAARPAALNALLAAFAGGGALLGAIVLAEALGPPVALRPHEPPH